MGHEVKKFGQIEENCFPNYKKLGFQIVAEVTMKVGNVIEHSGHLFFEKVL